jgi:hypothetical protein
MSILRIKYIPVVCLLLLKSIQVKCQDVYRYYHDYEIVPISINVFTGPLKVARMDILHGRVGNLNIGLVSRFSGLKYILGKKSDDVNR